ncbi:MAG: hypothetical protein QNJ51_11510 [Calothrix sp. MO_167.B12]|nr:hypothetical protein [Calothrix sp. MO_167.B12]
MAIGSFIFPLEKSDTTKLRAYTCGEESLNQRVFTLPSPIYFLAICSDEETSQDSEIESIYASETDDLLETADIPYFFES